MSPSPLSIFRQNVRETNRTHLPNFQADIPGECFSWKRLGGSIDRPRSSQVSNLSRGTDRGAPVLVVPAISGYILITYLHSRHDHGHEPVEVVERRSKSTGREALLSVGTDYRSLELEPKRVRDDGRETRDFQQDWAKRKWGNDESESMNYSCFEKSCVKPPLRSSLRDKSVSGSTDKHTKLEIDLIEITKYIYLTVTLYFNSRTLLHSSHASIQLSTGHLLDHHARAQLFSHTSLSFVLSSALEYLKHSNHIIPLLYSYSRHTHLSIQTSCIFTHLWQPLPQKVFLIIVIVDNCFLCTRWREFSLLFKYGDGNKFRCFLGTWESFLGNLIFDVQATPQGCALFLFQTEVEFLLWISWVFIKLENIVEESRLRYFHRVHLLCN